ncbi:MAG: hypothetical protein ABEJ65_08295, partial [bacterium]
RTLTPHLTCRGALIASDWSNSYFSCNPWDQLNMEAVIPEKNAPVDAWRNQWKNALNDWGLSPVQ